MNYRKTVRRLVFLSLFAMGGITIQAQSVTKEFKETPLSGVLKEVEKQTGFSIMYNNDDLSGSRAVTRTFEDASIEEVLKAVLPKNLEFKLQDKMIVIFKKGSQGTQQKQVKRVSGVIIDAAGEPIIGANVLVKGTTNGVITDIDGNYALENVPADAVITISYIGYKSLELKASSKELAKVVLKEDNEQLEEVVVVGYSKRSREKLISSVATIKTESLVQSSVPNLENALSGKVSGVFSRQSSGEPGKDDANLTIRGFGQALVVVDGIPNRSFSNIDPEEIESISVLKDASAAAVYGMQGANGVILVTTKRGQRNQRTSIDINAKYSVQSPYNYPEAASTDLWQTLVNEYNANLKLINNRYAVITPEEMQKRDYAINTNWYDEMVQDAPIVQANMKISGGSENVSYFIFGGYMHQDGIWTTNSTARDRFNFRANVDFDFWQNFKGSLNVGTIINKNKYPGANSDMIAREIKYTAPNIPIRWEEHPEYYAYGGEGTYNPMALADPNASGYQKSEANTTNFDFSLDYKAPFLEGLSFKGVVGYSFTNSLDKNWFINPVYMGYRVDSDEYYLNAAASNSNKASLSLVDVNSTNLTAQGFISYANSFGLHSVNSGLVFEAMEERYKSFMTSRGSFPSSAVDQLPAGNSDKLLSNNEVNRLYRSASLIGRFSYDYASKYFIDFNFRYDGAQYFANKWGFFPSFSVGWMLTKEDFMQSAAKVLNELKFRMSWGKLGDLSAAKSYYTDNDQYYFQSGFRYPGTSITFGDRTIYALNPTLNPNADFTWATSQMYNVGFDFKLWQGLFSGSFDAFYRKRSGLPAQKANDNAGALATWYNLNGDNTRGIEFSLNHQHKIKDFSYFINTNFSWSRTKYGHVESAPFQNGYSEWMWHSQDHWSNVRWGLKCIGRYESYEEIEKAPIHKNSNNNAVILPGDLKYEDYNKDGYIDEKDYQPIGRSAYPEIVYGFTLGASWKNFDFSAFFQGAALCNFEISAFDKDAFEEGKTYKNTWKYFGDRWHKADYTDPNSPWIPGHFPAVRDMNTLTINHYPSDFWFFNGNYLRLKNIELGYTLPSVWLQQAKIQSLRVFISAYNLFTWSSQPYFDPEQRETYSSFASYPQIQSFNVGVSLKF